MRYPKSTSVATVKLSNEINASLRVVPVYRKHLGRAEAWNIFWNNFEEYATTNETDFMGSVTMSPASGRQISYNLKVHTGYHPVSLHFSLHTRR